MIGALLLARLALPLWLGPPACLTADSLDPAAGQGASAVFEAVYGHCEGATTFRVVQLWVGDEVSPSVDAVNLGYEGGVFSLGKSTCAPGDAVVLHDSMGSLDCAASSVTLAGNQATVRWAIEFDTVAFAGSHGVFFDAKGGRGDPEPRLGWTQMGTFIVEDVATDTSGGGTTSGGTTGTSSSGADDSGDGSSDGSSGVEATSETDGLIPGGGVTQRGGGVGCSCSVDAEPTAWWLVLVLACARRRRHLPISWPSR